MGNFYESMKPITMLDEANKMKSQLNDFKNTINWVVKDSSGPRNSPGLYHGSKPAKITPLKSSGRRVVFNVVLDDVGPASKDEALESLKKSLEYNDMDYTIRYGKSLPNFQQEYIISFAV